MKNYEKIINKQNEIQNVVAFNILLTHGRNTLLNEQSFNEIKDNITDNSFMTKEYYEEALETAKKMAKLSDNDLNEYVYDKVKEQRRRERNR